MLGFLRSYTKRFLLTNSPVIYTLLFKVFQRGKQILGKDVSDDILKVANFTKKGFYEFHLDDVKFDMYLNPINGWVDSSIFLYGSLEPKFLSLIRKNIKKDDVFFDIGANIGQHGLYASNFCKSVYSFEPIQRLYNQLELSINRNNFNNIHAFNIGLGNEEKEIPIYSDAANVGGSSVLISAGKFLEQVIQIKKLDDFLLNNPTEVNMVKIDVEGFELEVLLGARKMFEKYKPKLLIEFSPPIYNTISSTRGEEIYLFLSGIYSKINNVGLDLEISQEIYSYNDLLHLNHHTNLWCTN